jgi:hypothetical protein
MAVFAATSVSGCVVNPRLAMKIDIVKPMPPSSPRSSMMARALRNAVRTTGMRPCNKRGQHADGEGGVGCHGDAPAMDQRRPSCERSEYQRRHQHAAQCGGYHRNGLASALQFAHQQFALDFQTEHEKKQAHHAFVDPVAQASF